MKYQKLKLKLMWIVPILFTVGVSPAIAAPSEKKQECLNLEKLMAQFPQASQWDTYSFTQNVKVLSKSPSDAYLRELGSSVSYPSRLEGQSPDAPKPPRAVFKIETRQKGCSEIVDHLKELAPQAAESIHKSKIIAFTKTRLVVLKDNNPKYPSTIELIRTQDGRPAIKTIEDYEQPFAKYCEGEKVWEERHLIRRTWITYLDAREAPSTIAVGKELFQLLNDTAAGAVSHSLEPPKTGCSFKKASFNQDLKRIPQHGGSATGGIVSEGDVFNSGSGF